MEEILETLSELNGEGTDLGDGVGAGRQGVDEDLLDELAVSSCVVSCVQARNEGSVMIAIAYQDWVGDLLWSSG